MAPHLTWIENNLKGKIAELLSQHLLQASGNQVIPYGYETTLSAFTQPGSDLDREGEVAGKIQTTPDFVVKNTNGKASYLEIKYRADASGKAAIALDKMVDTIHQDWPARVLRVRRDQRPYFEVALPPSERGGGELTWLPITDITDWQIKPEILEGCEVLVERYFPVSR